MAAADAARSFVVATGLDSPRGLRVGPDGSLYVAEGGRGGSESTVGRHPQIPAPIGPYSGGLTARISRIDAGGVRTTVADGLPSSQSSPGSGSLVSGVADVEFAGTTLYALVAGGGASHGLESTANGIYRVAGDGATLAADLGAFLRSHPVATPDPNDDEYDGTWFSMAAADGVMYALEPNHGSIERVGLDGNVERLVDLSATLGHVVPTALAWRTGDGLVVGNLGRFPTVRGASAVWRVDADGRVSELATGFTAILGLAFDPSGTLWAVEATAGSESGRPIPGTGRVVRVTEHGPGETLAEGLMLPTALTFGPDGTLYVSVNGFGPSGKGEILRIAR